jgi:nicotinamidase-related amidase
MYALIVVDMLNDFVTGSLACPRAVPIIPNIKKIADAARTSGNIVVFSNDAHIPDKDLEFKIWGAHAVEGTPGAQVIPELTPQPQDRIIPKRRYSGFYGTDMDMFLKEKGVTTVIVTGIHTHICVRHTTCDAFLNGYNIIVPEDGVESFTEQDHIAGLAYLKQVYGAKIMKSDDVVKELRKKK